MADKNVYYFYSGKVLVPQKPKEGIDSLSRTVHVCGVWRRDKGETPADMVAGITDYEKSKHQTGADAEAILTAFYKVEN